MGSGTTAVACMETDRNYIGFELSPAYWQVSQDRVQNYTKTGNTTIPVAKKPKTPNTKKQPVTIANPELFPSLND
jgi:DNA modification methylase